MFGHQSDMLSSSNSSQDGGLLSCVLDSLSCQEGCSSIRKLKYFLHTEEDWLIISHLNDNWGIDISCSLQDGVDGGG